MARKLRDSPSLKRKKATITPNIKIIAFCEGKNTEPHYLETFKKMHGNGLVEIFPIKAAGVPFTLVKSACIEKKALEKIAKKSQDPLDKKFQVWAMFDRDEHPKITESFKMAKDNNVYVAYSNPCFEIWPMLHIKDITADIHRHALQKKLEKIIDGYDSKGSKEACPEMLSKKYKGSYETAKARAISLEKQHKQVGVEKGNPYTDVYKLFDLIIKNGKSKNSLKD
jgi:hypothetical protein